MKSINFPKMLNSNSSNVIKDEEATLRNLRTLLSTEKGEFIDDPFFGIRLKRYIFEQNNYVLRDILIDEIYTQITVFMPQLLVKRDGISIIQDRGKLYANIKVMDRVDFTTNMYSLVLFEREDE